MKIFEKNDEVIDEKTLERESGTSRGSSMLYVDDVTCAKLDFERMCNTYITMANCVLGLKFDVIIRYFGILICCFAFTFGLSLSLIRYSLLLSLIIFGICFVVDFVIIYKIIIMYYVNPKHEFNCIKNTKCYRGILEKIKSCKLNKILYISIDKNKIVFCDIMEKKVKISFSEFDFPSLSIDKQPLLLVALVSDLLKRSRPLFRITNDIKKLGLDFNEVGSEDYIYKNIIYHFDNLFVAVNHNNLRHFCNKKSLEKKMYLNGINEI